MWYNVLGLICIFYFQYMLTSGAIVATLLPCLSPSTQRPLADRGYGKSKPRKSLALPMRGEKKIEF